MPACRNAQMDRTPGIRTARLQPHQQRPWERRPAASLPLQNPPTGKKHAPERLGRVLVLGLGKSGRAVAQYCLEQLGGRVCLLAVAAGEQTESSEEFAAFAAEQGAAVSLSRNDVDYVVTEYGAVRLRGLNLEERARRLISIAHPKFRAELSVYAREYMIMP